MSSFTLGPIQEAWLRSLEEHPERQGTGSLGRKMDDGTYQACCLGELGLIAGLCKFDDLGKLRTSGKNSGFFDMSDWKSVGLFGPFGNSMDSVSSLAAHNDSGKTWPEIAAMIRANPEHWLKESK